MANENVENTTMDSGPAETAEMTQEDIERLVAQEEQQVAGGADVGSADAEAASEGSSDIDATLDDIAGALDALNNELTEDEAPAVAAPAQTPAADEADTGNDMEDLLASLGAEVDEINGGLESTKAQDAEAGAAVEEAVEEPQSDVDNLLASLGQEVEQLSEDVAAAAEAPVAAPADEAHARADADGQDDVDDLLASLGSELEQANTPDAGASLAETDRPDQAEATVTDAADEDSAAEMAAPQAVTDDAGDASDEAETVAGDDVDDLLATLSADMDTAEEDTQADAELDVELNSRLDDGGDESASGAADEEDFFAAATRAKPAEISEEATDAVHDVEDAVDMDDDLPIDADDESPEGVSEDEQVLMEEIAAVEAGGADADERRENKAADPKPQFSSAQRAVIKGLETANQPFAFVPDPAKDTLGLVAVVTLIVVTIGASLILLF